MQNKSFTYLLPLYCKYLYKENSKLEESLFINFIKKCYSYQKVNDQLDNCFIIQLEKPIKNDNIFNIFLENIKKSSIFVDFFEDKENR